jgi:hypothetical protein
MEKSRETKRIAKIRKEKQTKFKLKLLRKQKINKINPTIQKSLFSYGI